MPVDDSLDAAEKRAEERRVQIAFVKDLRDHYWERPHRFEARGFNRCSNVCVCIYGKEHPIHQVSK